jgi:hypothetical protein
MHKQKDGYKMNTTECYQRGHDTGYDIAECNIHEPKYDIFNEISKDEFISDMVTHEQDAYRQYSPFEFFARDINNSDNSEELWEEYDNGVFQGILACIDDYKRKRGK